MFHVGMKVITVDDTDTPCVRNGDVFTVAQVGDEFLWLVERLRVWSVGQDDGGMFRWRFRPVVERKTDISIFTAMLNPVPSKVAERVR